MDIFDVNARSEAQAIYCDVVDEFFARGADENVSNGKPEHAAYLIYKFLTNGTRSIKLFSGSLKQETSEVAIYRDPQIVDAARAFLHRSGTSLQVALENDLDTRDGEAHPLVAAVKQDQDAGLVHGDFNIRKVPERILNRLREVGYPYHFLVMDERAYRLETDKEAARATANFGDRTYARALSGLFDDIWEHSESATSFVARASCWRS